MMKILLPILIPAIWLTLGFSVSEKITQVTTPLWSVACLSTFIYTTQGYRIQPTLRYYFERYWLRKWISLGIGTSVCIALFVVWMVYDRSPSTSSIPFEVLCYIFMSAVLAVVINRWTSVLVVIEPPHPGCMLNNNNNENLDQKEEPTNNNNVPIQLRVDSSKDMTDRKLTSVDIWETLRHDHRLWCEQTGDPLESALSHHQRLLPWQQLEHEYSTLATVCTSSTCLHKKQSLRRVHAIPFITQSSQALRIDPTVFLLCVGTIALMIMMPHPAWYVGAMVCLNLAMAVGGSLIFKNSVTSLYATVVVWITLFYISIPLGSLLVTVYPWMLEQQYVVGTYVVFLLTVHLYKRLLLSMIMRVTGGGTHLFYRLVYPLQCWTYMVQLLLFGLPLSLSSWEFLFLILLTIGDQLCCVADLYSKLWNRLFGECCCCCANASNEPPPPPPPLSTLLDNLFQCTVKSEEYWQDTFAALQSFGVVSLLLLLTMASDANNTTFAFALVYNTTNGWTMLGVQVLIRLIMSGVSYWLFQRRVASLLQGVWIETWRQAHAATGLYCILDQYLQTHLRLSKDTHPVEWCALRDAYLREFRPLFEPFDAQASFVTFGSWVNRVWVWLLVSSCVVYAGFFSTLGPFTIRFFLK